MNKPNEYTSPDRVNGKSSPSMVFSFVISIILHVVIVGAVIFVPHQSPGHKLSPGVVNVRLVSLPGAGASPTAGPPVTGKSQTVAKESPKAPVVKAPPKKAAPILAPPKVEKPKKKVSLAPVKKPEKKKIKPKKSLKKKTIDREKMIDSAIGRIEKKMQEPDASSVSEAIANLRKKVADTESSGPQTSVAPNQQSQGGAGIPGGSGGGGGGARAIQLIDIYRAEIAYQVEKNWAFSPQLAGNGKQLQASIVFKVLPSGEISDIKLTEKSSNSYLDDSAFKAIAKSNPVSPHPAGLNRPYVMVGIRFTPEGLK